MQALPVKQLRANAGNGGIKCTTSGMEGDPRKGNNPHSHVDEMSYECMHQHRPQQLLNNKKRKDTIIIITLCRRLSQDVLLHGLPNTKNPG